MSAHRYLAWAVALTAALVGAAACERRKPRPTPREIAAPTVEHDASAPAAPSARWFRLTIRDGAYEVPFLLSMPPRQGGGMAVIVNGSERLEAPAAWRGDHLRIDFPVYGNQLELDVVGDRASGTWNADSFLTDNFPVDGEAVTGPDPALRMTAGDPPAGDVSGLWVLDIPGVGVGKARLTQSADGVVGGALIATDYGDSRFLAGRLRGRSLALSTFDGMRAYAVVAELSEDGTHLLRGAWHYPGWSHNDFSGERGRDIPLAEMQTARLRHGATRISVPELADPKYRGKPIVVDYFGTWCASCQDLTPLLIAAYRRHHAAGLEVISIALQPYDAALARQLVAEFHRQFAVPYEIALRVVEGDNLTSSLAPELENVVGFPLTVFINRDGTVRGLHTGVISPAAGEDYQRFRADFDAMIDGIVASRP